MTAEGLKFGALVRREREAREIGLREMAKKIGVSPTYMSKIERDEFTPPTEDKVSPFRLARGARGGGQLVRRATFRTCRIATVAR